MPKRCVRKRLLTTIRHYVLLLFRSQASLTLTPRPPLGFIVVIVITEIFYNPFKLTGFFRIPMPLRLSSATLSSASRSLLRQCFQKTRTISWPAMA